ncbi:glycoside hydrolase family 15 protein [Yinghuangia seranimata]|uniref:glycoside hydrolase family 15 protein n=1 Tax=Yinghuangia seranimata TaxID=408067 RepID=UPI00248ABC37|nr:glycoside hydrolase family 15 protein [Yinghuangia seranimata]MDI2132701.1 hypothetical protein [Yinghuangia seranimata]
MRRAGRWIVVGVVFALLGTGIALAAVDDAGAPSPAQRVPALVSGGVAADPDAPDGIVELPPGAPPTPPTEAERAWLDAGRVPGAPGELRETAERALLDMRLLTRPDGGVAAAWSPIWRYTWPRDAAWVSAAYSATGHGGEALAVLRHLAALQRRDGGWEARYRLDGRPVADGREAQLDASGWVPWAVWFWYAEQDPADPSAAAAREELWPAVRAAADRAAASLGEDGIPGPGADYWETRTDQRTLGTAAPLLAGLHAAADLARTGGHGAEAERWAHAADVLRDGIRDEFGQYGYGRTPSASGLADTAVTWLALPFAAPEPDVTDAVHRAAQALTLDNGGILPGNNWRGHPQVAWTPETASFALYDAASGNRAAAEARLLWLARHRTPHGSLPEKVAPNGRPASVAPLAWTAAAVILATTALDRPLPTPPG